MTSTRRSRTTGDVPEDLINSSSVILNLRLAVSATTSEQLRDTIAYNYSNKFGAKMYINRNVPEQLIIRLVVRHIFHDNE